METHVVILRNFNVVGIVVDGVVVALLVIEMLGGGFLL